MTGNIEKKAIPYNSQLDAFELYHLVLENENGRSSSLDGGPVLPALGHAVAGSIATAASKLLIYPLDLIIARLQVQKQLRGPQETPSAAGDVNAEYSGLIDAVKKIYYHEGGIKAFYTGCAPDVAKGIADSFLFFLAYSFLRQYERSRSASKKQLSVPKELAVGIAAGAFSKLVTTPLQNIITRKQTAALLTARDPEAAGGLKKGDEATVADIARQIYRERGLQGFWAGYSASLILTLNPAVTFAADRFIQRTSPKLGVDTSASYYTFLSAAVSKAIASTITYPVSVAKSRAQVTTHTSITDAEGTEKEEDGWEKTAASSASFSSSREQTHTQLKKALRLFSAQYAIFLTLRKIYRSEGLAGLYSGIEGEVLKGFLSHGLTMMMKDRVHVGVIQLYYTLLKLTRNWPDELEKAQHAASAAAEDAMERVENVGITIAEGGKSVLWKGKD